jgi:hypothetical protein
MLDPIRLLDDAATARGEDQVRWRQRRVVRRRGLRHRAARATVKFLTLLDEYSHFNFDIVASPPDGQPRGRGGPPDGRGAAWGATPSAL